MTRVLSVVLLSFLLIAALSRLSLAGPLQDCCSSKGAFCVLPWVGGAAACTATGGAFFQANACTATQECGVAHQVLATGSVSLTIETPFGPVLDVVPLHGAADVIETEMI